MKVVSSIKSWFSQLDTKKINNPKHLLIGAIALGALAYLAKRGYDSYKVACLLKECREKISDKSNFITHIAEIANSKSIIEDYKVSFVRQLVKELHSDSTKKELRESLLDTAINAFSNYRVCSSKATFFFPKAFWFSILEVFCEFKDLKAILNLEIFLFPEYRCCNLLPPPDEIHARFKEKFLKYYRAALKDQKDEASQDYNMAAIRFGHLCLESCFKADFEKNAKDAQDFFSNCKKPMDFEGHYVLACIHQKQAERMKCAQPQEKKSIIDKALTNFKRVTDRSKAMTSHSSKDRDIIAKAAYAYFMLKNPELTFRNCAEREGIVEREYLDIAAKQGDPLARLMKDRIDNMKASIDKRNSK